jgi:hypothetical protein
MKTSSTTTARVAISTLFFMTGLVLIVLALTTARSRSATPGSGSMTTSSAALAWDGNAIGTGSASAEDTCVENNPHLPGDNCDTFTLTVAGTPADWATASKRIEVRITPPASQDDYDLYIHKTNNSGPIVDSSGHGAGRTEVAHISPATDGVGVFTIHVVYFTTTPPDQYHGTATVVPLIPPAPPAAPADPGPQIGYENFEAPGVLTPVTTTTGATVEYMARGAGEPSIGVNWNSAAPNNVNGVTNFQSDLETLFVTFTNACSTGGPTATWVNRPAPTSQVIDSDPIGFTDRQTGRVFAAELSATSPTCKISYSDDDGQTWVPSSGPVGSGIDHETIGGGPYHAPLTGTPAYPNAVYYCSQDLVAAFCLRSDNGGQTFGPVVPTYTSECDGLHGHVKVSPKDGTVFLPNNNCGAGGGAVVVSEDNGVTWQIRPVKNATFQTTSGASDPAVGIDNNGRVYFAMANADASPLVATSVDHGLTWQNIFGVGGAFGLQNIRYPAAVAADAGRAAVAFLGSTTSGSANAASFNGVWHLYVAHTFDGGLTWTTSDATPGAPMQRGNIWTGGGANIGRNLLDFFGITVDKQGRVQVGYVNGCPGGNCAQAAPTATGNAYSATGTIARQSSGRRLLAAFDPSTPTSVPGMPFVTQRRAPNGVHLGWSEADTGNSAITSYQIFRGTSSNTETLFATVPGTTSRFDDTSATDITKTYFYKVVAVNAVGTSCGNNEVAAPYLGDTCTGFVIHKNDPTHPESAAANANPALAIDYVAVAEPPSSANFMFRMKVTSLASVPPNSRWRMVWNSFASSGQQFYVGMNTDASGAATFTYGTVATAVVGLVVGVPQETQGTSTGDPGVALPQSNFNADGTITIFVPKSKVGNPKPGDLLGAVNGRTFSDNSNLERSTGLIDHTFVKAQTDNAFPAATYTVVGNDSCAPHLLNISTRGRVDTADNVLIGGFIVTGTDQKRVLVRGIGPSLNVPGALQDPFLELHDDSGILATNDNWRQNETAILNTGTPPKNDAESAIVMTLAPGHYTAVLKGAGGSTGIGVVEAYDLDQTVNSQFGNISTRGTVSTGDNVLIGGFILGGGRGLGNATVVVRAIGPSLTSNNIANPVQDPTLDLVNASGTVIASNDDWQSDPGASQIQGNNLAPTDLRESATIQPLAPGNYTAIVRGKSSNPAVGVVEVYNLQ